MGEEKIKHAISNLEEFANNVRVLGSYPVYAPSPVQHRLMLNPVGGPF